MTGTSAEAIRIELNRLNRAVVRELDQAKCDELEARIQVLELALARNELPRKRDR